MFVSAEPGKPAHFKFEGIIDGVSLEAKITPLEGDTSSSRLEDRVRIGLSRGSGAVPGQTIRGERAGGALVARRFPR